MLGALSTNFDPPNPTPMHPVAQAWLQGTDSHTAVRSKGSGKPCSFCPKVYASYMVKMSGEHHGT